MKSKLFILRPILAILILFIPLYPKFPLFFVNKIPVALRLDDIIISLALFAWIYFQYKNKFPIFKEKITILFISYFIAITISFITAAFIYQTEPISNLILYLLRRFEYISLFFITISAVLNYQEFKKYYLISAISIFFVTLYGYGQKYLSFPVISTMNNEFAKGQLLEMNIWTRVSSTFAGHYDLAAYLSVYLIIVLGATFLLKNIWLKILNIILFLLAFQILSYTASRVSTIAFWGGGVMCLFLLKKYLWIIPFSILLITTIFFSKDLNQRLVATLPSNLRFQFNLSNTNNIALVPTPIQTNIATPTPNIPSKITKNISPIPTVIRHTIYEQQSADVDTGVARSGEIRFNVEWPRAINAFRKNYLLGSGLGSITLATDNDYLRTLGESGLIGFISFFVIIFYFIQKSLKIIFNKKHKHRQLLIIFLSALIVMLANATFIDVFEASKVAYHFWIMMGFYYILLKSSE